MDQAIEIAPILGFLAEIGIPVHPRELGADTFLPGLELGAGCIYVDYPKLKYPGDLLHEAGHLAVTPAQQRHAVGSASLELPWPTDGEEIGAVLWSYAAALHIGLPLEVVFHPHGYKNDAAWLIETFAAGQYIGLPFLEWAGLGFGPQLAQARGVAAFPEMVKWLRD
jgi:hypothetical protein